MSSDMESRWENNFESSEQAYREIIEHPDAYIEHHKGGDNLSWDLPRYKSTPLYTADKLSALEESECNAWKTVAKLRHRVSELEAQLEKNNPLLDEAANKIDALEETIAAQAAVIEKLREVLQITHDLYAQAPMGYGFAKPENPHNYWPDIESCAPEEIAAHAKACDDYASGKRVVDESWGIGTYSDEYAPAIEALAIPTDSKEVLKEWLDSVMGEPVGWTNDVEISYAHYTRKDGENTSGEFWKDYTEDSDIPLFRKPEVK